MFGISTIWLRLAGAAAIVVVTLLAVRGVYNRGYEARDSLAREEAGQAQQRADDELDALKSTLAALKSSYEQERKDAQQKIDSYRVQLASGALRLRIPTVAAGSGVRSARAPAQEARAQPDEAAAPNPAPSPERKQPEVVLAEIEPATAIELLSITADGDAAIRDLNECIDSYDALRKRLHGLQRID